MSPLLDIQERYPEVGRIRIGAKNERGLPTKLTTLRFTSPDRGRIEAIAELYGGTVQPWESNTGPQWEVITEASEVECVVPPQRIHDAQAYELWGKASSDPKAPVELLRRCDSKTQQNGADCVCDPTDRECKPRTHLLVWLPQVPGFGSWRLTTSGFNAAAELPSAVDLLAEFARAGAPVRAVFGIRQARSAKGGQVHRYVVPYIDIPGTAAELFANLPAGVGEQILALGGGTREAPATGRPALPPAPAAGALPAAPDSPSFPDVVEVQGEFTTPSDPGFTIHEGSGPAAPDSPSFPDDVVDIEWDSPTSRLPVGATVTSESSGPAAHVDTSNAATPTADAAAGPDVSSALADHLAALPADSDTMPVWDAYCRDLFQLMERAGYWLARNDHGDDSLHAALRVKHGADHLAALKKAQLVAFTKLAHMNAAAKTEKGTP